MTDYLKISTGIAFQIAFWVLLAAAANNLTKIITASRNVLIQLTAIMLTTFWLGSIVFNVLIILGLFKPLPAMILAIFLYAIMHWKSNAKQNNAYFFKRLAKILKLVFRNQNSTWPAKLVTNLFLIQMFILITRSLLLPMITWDSLTYHTLKVNLWLQDGCYYNLEAPGLWQSYKTFFGAGESFTALSMLFTRHDILGSIPDSVIWMLFGITSFSLFRELRLRNSSALCLSGAFLTTPAIMHVIGSGYVDNAVSTFLLAGCLFFIRFVKTRKAESIYLASIAYGLAGSVKVNGLATAIIMIALVLVAAKVIQMLTVRIILLTSAIFIGTFSPWLYFNYKTSGFILGTTPAKVGSLIIGQMPPELIYFFSNPQITPYSFSNETIALIKTLSSMGLLIMILPMLIRGALTISFKRPEFWIAQTQAFILLLLYYSPSFSVIRLIWADVNGRFIISALVLLSAIGIAQIVSSSGNMKKFIEPICRTSIIAGFFYYCFRYILLNNQQIEIPILVSALTAFSMMIFITFSRVYSVLSRGNFTVLSMAVAICMLTFVVVIRDSIRMQAQKYSVIFHNHPRYWTDALKLIDEAFPLKIAHTYGIDKLNHRAFIAPFFGARLQNEVCYVSPLADGRTPVYHPDYIDKEPYCYESWIKRLREQKVTHLLCFAPRCRELGWARSHPESFKLLVGNNVWGFFEIR